MKALWSPSPQLLLPLRMTVTMSRRRWWTGSTGKQRPSGPSGPAAGAGRCHFSKHTFQNSNLELSGDHGLDGVYGVGKLGKRLGLVLARTTSQQARVHDRLAWDSTSRFHKNLMSAILNLPLGPTNIVPQQISFLFQKERSMKSDTLETASRPLAEVIWKENKMRFKLCHRSSNL